MNAKSLKQKLEVYCEFINGGAWNESEYTDSGIPVLKVSNIKNQTFSLDDIDYLSIEGAKKYAKNLLNQYDLIVATVGSHPNLINSAAGRTISVPQSLQGYLLNQNAVCIRTKDNDVLFQPYLRYIGETDFFRAYIQARGKGAANQMRIAIGEIKELPINLPELDIQKKIAAILSAYDDLIENNLKRIKLLEEMAQITYEEWFVRLKYPGHETTQIDSETGLPVGWSEAEITAISFINTNSIKAKEAPESIKYIDIASADTGFYQEPQTMNYAEAPSRARRKVNFGDTIFSTVRPNRKTYSLILENDPMLVASTGFAVLTPKIEETFPFVYLTVANQTFIDKAVAVAGGAAYPAINQNDFEKIKIVKPDDALIKFFSEKVINNFTAKRTLTKQNQLLKEARDILLPRLMTGMIDVDTVGADLSA